MGKFSLKDLFSSSVGALVDSVGNAIDKNVTNKEEKMKLQKEIEKQIQDFTVEMEALNVENTKSAREMQIAALQQEDKFSKRFAYYLAMFWSIVGAGYLVAATWFPVVNEKMADTVLGFLLGTIVATIINYFYGSSKGSKEKQDVLNLQK